MRKHSTVLTQIFLQIHPKQRFRLKMYMYIRSLLSKTCSSGIVFGKFNQIYPCTFKNLTIFLMRSPIYALGICLPRGRSRSIINIPVLEVPSDDEINLSVNWSKLSTADKDTYARDIDVRLTVVKVPVDAICCKDTECSNEQHLEALNVFYEGLVGGSTD